MAKNARPALRQPVVGNTPGEGEIGVATFIPKEKLDASQNMTEFVQFCRDGITALGEDLDFDAPEWPLSRLFIRRGEGGTRTWHFARHGELPRRPGDPFTEPFSKQLKAYVRYEYSRTGQNMNQSIIAARSLFEAFVQKKATPDLTLVDKQTLDAAVLIAEARSKNKQTAGSAGQKLRALAEFPARKKLAAHAPLDWEIPLKGYATLQHAPSGAAAAKWHARRMPSGDALEALADAYWVATSPRDQIITSVLALLCCAPSRINEVFGLPVDAVLQPLTGDDRLEIRWAGSKGHSDFIKGIPRLMADTARAAISRIGKHTAEARRIGAWYENNPGSLYLPDDCADLRGKYLTTADISRIVGLTPVGVRLWLGRKGLKPAHTASGGGRATGHYKFADFEGAMLSCLPPDFPVLDASTGLKYSEALMVAQYGMLREERRGTWRCMVSPVTIASISSSLGGKSDRDSIFDRLNLSTPDNPVGLRSHQLRHYLNTLAQRGGLTETEIAKWSGRKNVGENRVYDHRTDEEKIGAIRARELALLPPDARSAVKVNQPVSRKQIAEQQINGHATDFGFCEHDFSSAPCSMFMDCLHCTKHTCVKGHDPRHADRVRLNLEMARQSLARAEEAFSQDEYNSEDWVKGHTETVQRLAQLLALLTDPAVPDGTVIRLAKSGRYTLIEQAIQDHEELTGIPLLSPSAKAEVESAGKLASPVPALGMIADA